MRDLVIRMIAFALSLFYRRIDVAGAERMPPRGPVLVAANHFNSLCDALVLTSVLPRRPAFASAVFLFKKPILGSLLRWMGCVPIHRAIDEGADPSKNTESLGELGAKLRAGGSVVIFPEGISRLEPRLQKIKVGTARLAFGAEAAADWDLDLIVVPVGLQYEDSPRWRSAVRVEIGEPIRVADYREAAAKHERRAMGEMTRVLEDRLRAVSLHAETWQERGEALLAARCYLAEARDGHVRSPFEGEASPAGSDAARVFLSWRERAAKSHPERLAAITRRLRVLGRRLRATGLRPEDLDAVRRPVGLAMRLGGKALAWTIALPASIWGRANAWPLERAVVAYESRFNKDGLAAHSTWILFPGLILAPVFFAVQTAIFGAILLACGVSPGAAILWAVGYLVTLPAAWWVSLKARDRRREGLHLVRAGALLARRGAMVRGMLADRRAIARLLDRLIRDMQQAP